MGGKKVTLPEQRHRSFLAEVAAICLTAALVIETIPLMGLNGTVALNFSLPIDLVLKGFLLIAGSLGIIGLLNGNQIGIYFALLASILESVPGIYSLIETFSFSPINTASTIQALVSALLGIVTCVCIFRTVPLNQMDQVLSDSSSNSRELHRSLSASDYAIEVDSVVKKYFLGPVVVPALNGLSLKILKGEFVAIMGPSGSGKSTLLNLIGALDRPSSGRVFIEGVDILTLNDLGLAKLRNEKIGFVFQAYNLIARSSVLRNMELPALVKGYPKEERYKRINNLLTIVGLGDKAPRRPKTMSGGEQQRVAIARALINEPSILLADEPTGNIDSKTGSEIMGFLRKMNVESGVTVIMVSHDREVAGMADRIIHLRDGKITEEEIIRRVQT